MRRRLLALALVLALCALPKLSQATPGIFQGKVIEPHEVEKAEGWIFVQGRNGMLRKVEISRARIFYSDSVPAKGRLQEPAQALVDGAEVRVTAEQDGAGEWRAIRVEILSLGRHKGGKQIAGGKPAAA